MICRNTGQVSSNNQSQIAKMSDEIINPDKVSTAGGADTNSTRKLFAEGDAMDRFVRVFESSARRWELVMYPAMLAFVLLAAYGFFLIYSLSKDIGTMAQGMDPELGKHLRQISESVIYLSENMRTMTRRIYHMSESMEAMADRMETMEYMEPMLANMYGIGLLLENINKETYTMIQTMEGMRDYMGDMTHSMQPMDRMNNITP